MYLILKETQTLVEKLIPTFFPKMSDSGGSKHAQVLQNTVSGKTDFRKTDFSPLLFFLPISFMYCR